MEVTKIANKIWMAKTSQQVIFNISQLPPGSYFLRLKGNNLETGKIILQK